MTRFLSTSDSWPLFIVRIFLGAVFIPHGLQKTIGTFGGDGYAATLDAFTGMGIPAYAAILVILGESLGALGLVFGFLTRLAALGIASIMAGAIALVHWENGFFMGAGGFEYHLLAIGMALSLLLGGGGKFSIDGALSSRDRDQARAPKRPTSPWVPAA